MTEDQKQRAIKALEWMIADLDYRNNHCDLYGEDSPELKEAKILLAELKGE